MFYRCSSLAPHSLNPCSASSTTKRRGGSRIFFRMGCTRLLLSSTPINYIVFFFCRIPVVLENRRSSQGEGGVRIPCTLPLDPLLKRHPCSIFALTVLRPSYTLALPRPCKGNWGLIVMGFCKTVCKLLVFTMESLHVVIAVCFKWLTLCESKNLSQHTQTEVSGSIQ